MSTSTSQLAPEEHLADSAPHFEKEGEVFRSKTGETLAKAKHGVIGWRKTSDSREMVVYYSGQGWLTPSEASQFKANLRHSGFVFSSRKGCLAAVAQIGCVGWIYDVFCRRKNRRVPVEYTASIGWMPVTNQKVRASM